MDRFDFFFLQLVSEGEIDSAFDASELAQQAIMGDTGLVGVAQGGVVVEHNPTADLTVDVPATTAYDPNGQRMRVPSLQVVNMAVDHLAQSTAVVGGGNTNILALFLLFDRSLSDPRIDGNSNQVFFQRDETFDFKVVQSGESPSPTPPALEVDKILLADITLSFGTTQIIDAIISTSRKQHAFVLAAGALSIKVGTPEEADQAILTELNNHITGVANLHPASSIDYAGGPNWADGTTNPATDVEAQIDKLLSELSSFSGGLGGLGGGGLLGMAARTTWLGGRTNPLALIHVGIDKIITDLNAQSAADDGMERIGGEARTSAASGPDPGAGSAASQIQAIIDDVGALSKANAWAAAQSLVTFIHANAPGTQSLAVHLGQGPVAATRYLRRFGRIHGAWSHWIDHFYGRDLASGAAINQQWDFAGDGGGSAPTIAANSRDGILDMATGTTANGSSWIHSFDRHWSPITNGVVFETIVQAPAVITSLEIEVGISDQLAQTTMGVNTADSCFVRFDTSLGDTNWTLVGVDGFNTTVTVAASSTAVVAGRRDRLTVECNVDGSAELFVNGVSEATIAAGSVGNGASDILAFKARVQTLNTTAKTLEVDKMEIWQNPIV